MSIYVTLWTLKFPREGEETIGCDWITVRAQAVPAHIGTPTPGHGYEGGDPYAGFLPPPVEVDRHGAAPYDRAVVFVTEHSIKGTERNPQEYAAPLLVLTGEEYARIKFEELHRRLCDALRRAPALPVAEVPTPENTAKTARPGKSPPGILAADLDLSKPVELVVLSVKDKAARCRLLRGNRVITVRATRLWTVVPGEIAVVQPRKQWSYAGHPYLSGTLESTRLDVADLGLVPLRLHPRGMWKPDEHYWGEPDEPIEEWAKPIIARGPRPEFVMEQILPGADRADIDSDPIIESNDLKDAGDRDGACRILMELCQADLRCLDAHAHLGNLAFDFSHKDAIRHYQVGVRIGELSLDADFDGLLPWGYIDNRPFLRCMSGLGLCLWRLNRFADAERVFDRMLWFNPSDNQGIRFLIDEVRAEQPWTDDRPEATFHQVGGVSGAEAANRTSNLPSDTHE
jgi:hypothetical protein